MPASGLIQTGDGAPNTVIAVQPGMLIQPVVLVDGSGNITESGGAQVVSGTVAVSSVAGTVTVTPPSSDYPAGAVPLTAASGSVANATATATLAASAAQKTWITGFEVTGSGITAVGAAVSVTVTGVVTGTLTYTYTAVVGAVLANPPLIVEFTKPIPSSAVNTAIAVSCPALGTGNTNNTVVAHGYQL